MLSQQQLKDNIPLLRAINSDEVRQLGSLVLDTIQYQTVLSTHLASLDFSDPASRQTMGDTLMSFVQRVLQSRASSNVSAQLITLGLDEERASVLATLISSRLDAICRDLASRSSGDKLSDLEWRFGLTAASGQGAGAPFVQMRIAFEKMDAVSVEMGMMEFYEFAADIKQIQERMSNTLGV